MSKFNIASMAAIAGLVMASSVALANETFIPSGHLYTPDSGPLPSLNSPQDRINSQTDIYQSEIWNKQIERKLFESDMQRLINRNLSPGPQHRPLY